MNTQFLIKICRLLCDWRKQTTQVKQRKIQHNTFDTEAYNLFTEFEWCQFRQITFYFSYLGSPVVSLIVETLTMARRTIALPFRI